MKVKELIEELQKYDQEMPVGIGNVEDDSDGAIIGLEKSAISKEETWDEFEQKPTGKHFLAIAYRCSMCGGITN